jgi:hypothetical protein
VLLEAAELPLPEATVPPALATPGDARTVTAASAAVPPPAPAAGDSMADSLRLRALKALVVALGLGAALWTAAVQIGPPGRTAPALVPAAPASPVPQPVTDTAPRLMPTLPRPLPAAPSSEMSPLPAAPAAPAAPRSAVAAPASAPVGRPGMAAPVPTAPASTGLPRLTASL